MSFFKRDRNKDLKKGLKLLEAITILQDKGLITVDKINRTANIHDSLWNITDRSSKKGYAKNLAIYISTFYTDSKQISVELFSMQTGRKIASFENDKATLC